MNNATVEIRSKKKLIGFKDMKYGSVYFRTSKNGCVVFCVNQEPEFLDKKLEYMLNLNDEDTVIKIHEGDSVTLNF